MTREEKQKQKDKFKDQSAYYVEPQEERFSINRNNFFYRLTICFLCFFSFYLLKKIDLLDLRDSIKPIFNELTFDWVTIFFFTTLIVSSIISVINLWIRLSILTLIGLGVLIAGYYNESAADAFASSISLIVSFTSVYIMLRGIYFMISLNGEPEWVQGFTIRASLIQLFDFTWKDEGTSKNEKGNLDNIERAVEFRNSKLGTMDAEKGAEYLRATSALDSALLSVSTGNSNAERTVEYMNGKLGAMSNEQGMEWLKGKR